MAGWVAMKSVVVLLAAGACALTLMAFASSPMEKGFESCEKMVQSWAHSSYAFDDETEAKQLKSLQDLLFFIHVPRSGGFAFIKCLLMQLYHDKQCPVSCDMQGWDSRKPKCSVLNIHGDYSLMSKFPKKRTSVVTMVRHPLDRVISVYELSTARAARYLLYPNMTSATEAAERQCSERPHTVCLLDIWPFKHLMTRLAVELFARGNQSMMSEDIDPYNLDQIAMPLHDFANDPIVHELVHNAATLQVAGLTEKSCLEESHAIRRCIRMHPSLGNYALDVAKKRLDKMLFVGLTEKHRESMEMFAHSIEADELQALSTAPQAKAADNYDTEERSSLIDVEAEKLILQQNEFTPEYRHDFLLGNPKMLNGNMTVENLMKAYDACATKQQELRAFEFTHFMKEVYPIKFSKKARKQIQDSVIQQILSFNNLDIELHKHAETIFKQQQERFRQRHSKVVSQKFSSISNWLSERAILAGVVLLCILAFLLNARKGPSKFKNN